MVKFLKKFEWWKFKKNVIKISDKLYFNGTPFELTQYLEIKCKTTNDNSNDSVDECNGIY